MPRMTQRQLDAMMEGQVSPASRRVSAKRDQPEKRLQSACIKLLELRGWRTPRACLKHQHLPSWPQNPVYWVCGTTRRTGDFQGTMQTPGIPDLCIQSGEGRMLGVELKSPSGRVSPEQEVLAQAGVSVIIRSVEEMESLLNSLGA